MATSVLAQNIQVTGVLPWINVDNLQGGNKPYRTYQVTVTGQSGAAVSATVNIEGTNDSSITASPPVLQTTTLSGTTQATDGKPSTATWQYIRVNVTAISGTGAAVTVTMGV